MAQKGELKNRVREKWKTNNYGWVEIIEYFGSTNCTVRFSDGKIRSNIAYNNIKSGEVEYPIERLGERFVSNQGCNFTIVEYFTSRNITVIFEDGNIVENLRYDNIKRGKVANPYSPSIFGVGFVGCGEFYEYTNGERNNASIRWRNMIRRCYSEKVLRKCPTYKDVTVCGEWKCFQNFAKWFYENYNFESMRDWDLDKDILIKGNKSYSPETCCFVPQEINTLFLGCNSKRGEYPIGVSSPIRGVVVAKLGVRLLYRGIIIEDAFQAYKIAKETYIKEVAELWKPLIKPEVYHALINYKVEITD